MMRNPVRQTSRRNWYSSPWEIELTRFRTNTGATSNPPINATGTKAASRGFQNHNRYRPANVVASQMLRVQPSNSATPSAPKQNRPNHNPRFFAAGDQNKNAASVSRTNIS